ncbi:MAG TPA: ribonuclease III, partial [Gammaproteobacteria bacterium]|nr:ribonuclease III [Gammaproteobacteria bacterium]
LPDPKTLKDPKSRLQEWLQSRGADVPDYRLLSARGKAHNMTFKAECRVPSLDIVTEAEGSSRRKAEQAAAQKALDSIPGADA